jgi:hypothetical protein
VTHFSCVRQFTNFLFVTKETFVCLYLTSNEGCNSCNNLLTDGLIFLETIFKNNFCVKETFASNARFSINSEIFPENIFLKLY